MKKRTSHQSVTVCIKLFDHLQTWPRQAVKSTDIFSWSFSEYELLVIFYIPETVCCSLQQGLILAICYQQNCRDHSEKYKLINPSLELFSGQDIHVCSPEVQGEVCLDKSYFVCKLVNKKFQTVICCNFCLAGQSIFHLFLFSLP